MLSQAFCYARLDRKAGRILFTSTDLTWRPLDSPQADLQHSLRFDQVKLQRISPDTKSKVQLQIVLTDESTLTFHFNNDAGRNAQFRDRDLVKNTIQYFLLEKNKTKQTEDSLKTKILSQDDEMLSNYKKLVASKIISPDVFWKEIAKEKFEDERDKLKSGISSSIISEITQEADSNAHSRFNLNDAIIENIFATFPIVKVKYHELVPDKLDEKEFWKQFFQSNFYAKTKPFDKDNILDGVLEDEIQTMKNNIDTVAADDNPVSDQLDNENGESPSSDQPEAQNPPNSKTSKLVDYINYSSSQIIESMISHSNIDKQERKLSPKKNKKDVSNLTGNEPIPLKIRKIDKFISGPVNSMVSANSTSNFEEDSRNINEMDQFIIGENEKFEFNLYSDSKVAENGLKDEFSIESHQWSEFNQIYLALCELLSKYWKLKLSNAKSIEHANILKTLEQSLLKFSAKHMKELEEKHSDTSLTKGIRQLIDRALA